MHFLFWIVGVSDVGGGFGGEGDVSCACLICGTGPLATGSMARLTFTRLIRACHAEQVL